MLGGIAWNPPVVLDLREASGRAAAHPWGALSQALYQSVFGCDSVCRALPRGVGEGEFTQG